MALRSSQEEREAKRQQKAAQKQEQQDARGRQARLAEIEKRKQAFYASPPGQARQAREGGQTYFQIEIPLLETARTVNSWVFGDVKTKHKRTGVQGLVLTEIEEEGWELFTASFVFHETGQVSRDKLLSTGQSTKTTGSTIGVYLFKATNEPPQNSEPWLLDPE